MVNGTKSGAVDVEKGHVGAHLSGGVRTQGRGREAQAPPLPDAHLPQGSCRPSALPQPLGPVSIPATRTHPGGTPAVPSDAGLGIPVAAQHVLPELTVRTES